MKKITIKFLLIVSLTTGLFSHASYSQVTLQWVKGIGGTNIDQGYSIAVDGSGNVYTTGNFGDTVDFDPGVGTSNLTAAGFSDIFISKLDAAGNFVWAKAIGGILDDEVYSIAVDASGNVYTTGYFQATVDFDPGVGISNLTAAGGFDIFISKLDAAGNFVWAKSIGGSVFDLSYSIAVDASGNVYTTGNFAGTVDFDPGIDTSNLTAAGVGDIFISKLDAAGNFIWAKAMLGTSTEESRSIAVDASGNAYITGNFVGTVDFDPGAGISNLTAVGIRDIFISKLDASGNFVWAKAMGGTSSNYGHSIDIDAFGNVYTTGYFQVTVDFDPGTGISNLTAAGGYDIFISKLDAAGNFVWAKGIGGTNSDYSHSITVDAFGNVYTTGNFKGSTDFDPNSGTSFLTSAAGLVDIFISKLDAMGNFVWAKNLGGVGNDYGFSIAVDAIGNIYTTGWFEGTADFDPDVSTSNLTSAGDDDIFVHKMSQNTVGVIEIYGAPMVYVYPNPTNDIINIVTVENVAKEIEILNAIGQTLYKKKLFGIQKINLSDFGSGVYTLKITSGTRTQFIKIMKQ